MPINKPRAFAASIIASARAESGSFPPGSTNSKPCMRPIPRASPTKLNSSTNSSNLSDKRAPLTEAFVGRSCSSMYSMVANALAIVTGFPPKVEKVDPTNASAISVVAIVHPMGEPFAIPLAKVMISGSTPQCSMPHHLSPVRPQPVCISSAMKTPPASRTIGTIRSKYVFGGVTKPPTPWMGSARNAAIRPLVVVAIVSSRSCTQSSTNSSSLIQSGARYW